MDVSQHSTAQQLALRVLNARSKKPQIVASTAEQVMLGVHSHHTCAARPLHVCMHTAQQCCRCRSHLSI